MTTPQNWKVSQQQTILCNVLFFIIQQEDQDEKPTTKAPKVVSLILWDFHFFQKSVSTVKRKGNTFLEKTDFHN